MAAVQDKVHLWLCPVEVLSGSLGLRVSVLGVVFVIREGKWACSVWYVVSRVPNVESLNIFYLEVPLVLSGPGVHRGKLHRA